MKIIYSRFLFLDVLMVCQGSWDTSSVTNMDSMFERASSFNQDISGWDVANVTDMDQMFKSANVFNQNLSEWCVSNINSEPTEFSTNSIFINSNKPIWGRCPSKETYVPDDNFEQALIDLGYDDTMDDYVITSNISSVTTLDVKEKGISSLEGIKSFSSLETLYFINNGGAPANSISTLDLSGLNNLTFIQGFNNPLTSLILPSNLEYLDISNNSLTQLDLTGLTKLETLYLRNSQLNSIDLSSNDNLEIISLGNSSNLTCVELSVNQYNNIFPANYSSGNLSIGLNQDNSSILNSDCSNSDMSNIIYVTSNDDSDYTIIGKDSTGDINGSDPTLNFNVGDAIYFYVNANGNGTPHYFHLKDQATTGTGNQISLSGTYLGLVIWKPDTAGTYYYQCRTHAGHGGEIIISN